MYNGFTHTSSFNINDKPAVTTTLNYNTINGYAIQETPVVQPYGFTSLAPSNASCIYNSLGVGYCGSYVSGYLNNNPPSNLSGLETGESATWNSANFTRQLKTTGVFDIFSGVSSKITSAALNGSNTNKIIKDLIAEITALELYINNVVAPAIPVSTYTPTANFITDRNFINHSPSQNFIDSNGVEL